MHKGGGYLPSCGSLFDGFAQTVGIVEIRHDGECFTNFRGMMTVRAGSTGEMILSGENQRFFIELLLITRALKTSMASTWGQLDQSLKRPTGTLRSQRDAKD